jgi:hypothetical protein
VKIKEPKMFDKGYKSESTWLAYEEREALVKLQSSLSTPLQTPSISKLIRLAVVAMLRNVAQGVNPQEMISSQGSQNEGVQR